MRGWSVHRFEVVGVPLLTAIGMVICFGLAFLLFACDISCSFFCESTILYSTSCLHLKCLNKLDVLFACLKTSPVGALSFVGQLKNVVNHFYFI